MPRQILLSHTEKIEAEKLIDILFEAAEGFPESIMFLRKFREDNGYSNDKLVETYSDVFAASVTIDVKMVIGSGKISIYGKSVSDHQAFLRRVNELVNEADFQHLILSVTGIKL